METRVKSLLSVLVISLVFFAGNQSQAALLRGYVKEDNVLSQTEKFNSAFSPSTTGGANVLNAQAQMSNSFPASYAGTWRCVSYVTDSQVDSVAVGNETVSQISFVRNNFGQLVAIWQQPGWTEARASVQVPNPQVASLDRTDYFYGQGLQGNWAARSRDNFEQTADNEMVALSYIDQYVDGQYIGRYHTKSILVRVSQPANAGPIAMDSQK
jgi:hypothetical protein